MDRWIDQTLGHEKTLERLYARLATDELAHGLAFVGPDGIGKKRIAFALAQAALCTGDKPPCGSCPSCIRVQALQHESLLIVGGDNGLKLEHAQQILDFLSLRSLSRRRFVIVDDATDMTPAFANALLKLLEEPPAGTHFIYLTRAVSQLLPTVRSRLQVVRFFPLADKILQDRSEAEAWAVAVAQGSFTRLEEWRSEDASELKRRCLSALGSLTGEEMTDLPALFADVKDRPVAEMVATLYQQFFRDALYTKEGLPSVAHADQKSLLEIWAKRSRAELLCLWRNAFRFGQDIAANLDRSLALEIFFQRARSKRELVDVLD